MYSDRQIYYKRKYLNFVLYKMISSYNYPPRIISLFENKQIRVLVAKIKKPSSFFYEK